MQIFLKTLDSHSLDSSIQRAWSERAGLQHLHLDMIPQAQRFSTFRPNSVCCHESVISLSEQVLFEAHTSSGPVQSIGWLYHYHQNVRMSVGRRASDYHPPELQLEVKIIVMPVLSPIHTKDLLKCLWHQ